MRCLISVFTLSLWNAALVDAMYDMTQPCTVMARLVQVRDGSDGVAYECELDPVDANGVRGIRVSILDDAGQPQGRGFDCGGPGCRSGQTKMWVDGATNANGYIKVVQEDKDQGKLTPSKAKIPPGQDPTFTNGAPARRSLVGTTGPKSVLIVRVNDVAFTPLELSNKVFGNSGDPMNLKSQMEACSYGQMQIIPATGTHIHNGVAELNLGSVYGSTPTSVMNRAITSLYEQYGISMSDYDHVMVSLEAMS